MTTMTQFDDTRSRVLAGLPDPDTGEEFYRDVPTKRFFAWVIDVIAITAITAVLVPFTAFTAVFYLPVLYAVVSFLYRWVGLSRHSATLGMRAVALEARRGDGTPFDTGTAALHTAGYFASVAVFPAQLVSIALMLMTDRRQGLTDVVMGTAILNRRAG